MMIKFNCYNKIEIKFKIINGFEELKELTQETIDIFGGFTLDSLQPGLGVTDEVEIRSKTINCPHFIESLRPFGGLLFRHSTAWFLNPETALEFVKICKSGKDPQMSEPILHFKSPTTLIV